MEIAASFLLLIVVAVLAIAALSVTIVRTQTAVVVERLGKFNRVLQPGLGFKLPIVERVAFKGNLRIQQLEVEIESKTKDNVFVKIPTAVQYRIPPSQVDTAFYQLEDPVDQIRSYVADTIRSSLSGLTLDEAFVSKDQIAQDVEQTLSGRMSGYGYNIVNTLVTDIAPDEEVKRSMNAINAAERSRDAQKATAEGEKIKTITQAEGQAEAQRLRGEGLANERSEIINGLAEQVQTLQSKGLDAQEAMQLLILNQYFDTLTNVADKSETNTLMLPSNPQGAGNIVEEIRNTIFSAKSQVSLTTD